MPGINLERFIASHYKAGVGPRDVLREALTNAIHANARNITVDLQFYDAQADLLGQEERPFLQAIEIIDDGDGFTKENLDAFDEVCTSHKSMIGGKGVGRLAFLKYAANTSVKSYTGEEFVEFNYDPLFSLDSVQSTPNTGPRKTTIRVSEPVRQVNTHVTALVEYVCDDLRLLLFFKEKQGHHITITFQHNSKQPFSSHYQYKSSDIAALHEGSFLIKDQIFETHLFRDEGGKGVTAILCADNVGVEDFQISKRFDVCRHLIFVTSPYFDGRANIERQKLELPKLDTDTDQFSTVSRESLFPALKEHCLNLINAKSSGDIDDYRAANIQKLRTYYPYIDVSSLGGAASMLDAEEVVRQYRSQKAKREDEVVEKLEHGRSVPFDDLSHLAQEDLARYIVHRALVLDSLSKLPRDAIEDKIHNAILPKRSDGEDIRENNVWLVDDKFLSYSSIHSDSFLSRVIASVNAEYDEKQQRRPDIAAFFSRNDKDQPNKLVLIEFKKPSADLFDNVKALSQCRYYASEIVERANSILEVFAFAVTEIDDAFYRELKQTNFKDVFSIGERILYQDFKIGSADSVPLHQYVMPASSLVRDAQARNRVFEKVLQLRVNADTSENAA